jgi:hypothetical protein
MQNAETVNVKVGGENTYYSALRVYESTERQKG